VHSPAAFPPTNVVFHDPAVFRQELEQLFEREWFFVGTLDELRTSGGLRYPLGGSQYHVVDEDGLRAWRQGGPPSLPVQAVGPYVFVHGGAPTRSLPEALGPQGQILDELGAAARGLLFEVRQIIQANWKLVVCGAIEDYHVPFVHGRSVAPWRREPALPVLHPGGHSSYSTSAEVGPLPRLLHGVIAGTRPTPHVFANHLVFPNLLTIRLWGIVHITTFVPLSPGRTLRRTRVYEHSPPGFFHPRRPLRALASWALRQGMSITFREDLAIAAEAQMGTAASLDQLRGPAHAEESRVEHFLQETARRLGASPP
jgi:hypothetical protein